MNDRACLLILAPSVPREATFGDEPMPAMEPTPGNPPEPADPGETALPQGLAPVTPAEADFEE